MYLVVAKMRRLISLSNSNSSSPFIIMHSAMEPSQVVLVGTTHPIPTSIPPAAASTVGADEHIATKSVTQITRRSEYKFAIDDFDVWIFLMLFCVGLLLFLSLRGVVGINSSFFLLFALLVLQMKMKGLIKDQGLTSTSKNPLLIQWHSNTLYLHTCHSLRTMTLGHDHARSWILLDSFHCYFPVYLFPPCVFYFCSVNGFNIYEWI